MKITMREVAKKANVSIATVSHVVNNTRIVSDETRKQVVSAINELHFYPDIMARNFKTGRKHIIGLIVPDVSNSFFAKIIEAIEDVLSNNHYALLILNTKEKEDLEINSIKLCSSGIVDGIIIASSVFDYQKIEATLPNSFPIVFIDRTMKNASCDTVLMSDYEAITDGIDILISHGHKKIGFIGALPELSTTQERFLAYKNQLAKNNLEINPELILFTHKLESDNQIQIKQILENGCTAIVACNNLITTNIIIYCDNHKISIPEQVEILGYKNSDRMDYFLPESLYIKQPVLQMGRIAATRMLQILSDEEPTTQNSIIPSALDIDFSNSNRN